MPAQIRIEDILPPANMMPQAQFKRVDAAIEVALRTDAKNRVKDGMKKRTQGWSTNVQFAGRFSKTLGSAGSMYVFPRAAGGSPTGRQVWTWVSKGTKPRVRRARQGGKMRIRGGIGGYKPKTAPGGKYGGPGTYDHSKTFYARQVRVGIKARNIEDFVVKEVEGPVVATITAAIRKAL